LEEIFGQQAYALPGHVREVFARLGRPPRVLDLGGHIGLFALYVFGLYPDAKVSSVEPDPTNLELLRSCVRLNAREEQWAIVAACAGVSDGVASFVSRHPSYGDFARSHVAQSSRPGQLEVARRDIFPLMDVDLVKFDIEGGEWAILNDPRFARVRPTVVVLEYHPYLCPEEDALACAIRLLGESGYQIGAHVTSCGGEGILWAWSGSEADAA
jgi:FkbM family methyltransferase